MPNLFPAARGYVLGMQTWTSGRLWSGAEMSPQHPSFWNKVGAGWSEIKVDAQTVQGTANLLVATMPSHVLCRLCLPLHLALDYSCLWVSLCVFVLSLSLSISIPFLFIASCVFHHVCFLGVSVIVNSLIQYTLAATRPSHGCCDALLSQVQLQQLVRFFRDFQLMDYENPQHIG